MAPPAQHGATENTLAYSILTGVAAFGPLHTIVDQRLITCSSKHPRATILTGPDSMTSAMGDPGSLRISTVIRLGRPT